MKFLMSDHQFDIARGDYANIVMVDVQNVPIGPVNNHAENVRPSHSRTPLARARLAINLVACHVLRWSASNGS